MADKPIAITCGDPAGIGPEIICGYFLENPADRGGCCLIGPRQWLGSCPQGPVVEVGDSGYQLQPGKPDNAGAVIAMEALEEAAYGCRQGRYRAVVTGPVNKTWMDRIGWNFPGQTEFFGDRWHARPVMAFAGGLMKVVLATWHISLRDVAAALEGDALERAVMQADWLAKRLGVAQPRIGVCGLNPHAGENGLLGYEEQGILNPLLEPLRERLPGLSLCQPADTLFHRHLIGEFDIVVALYHDQGLAPLKAVDFDNSANLSLGLPFIRTSPDHGTAYGLAGSGRASGKSFATALRLALKLS